MAVVEARDLHKSYPGGVEALRGVSFRMEAGEVFGLLGPNGAGKSTTVRILCTLSPATSGRATVAGHDVEAEPEEVRRRIGYVAQSSGVDTTATGRENLQLQARLHGMTAGEARRRCDELLETLGLAGDAGRTVSGYSGGMKRRLDLAMGIVHRPRVLFLDEPTTGLDPEIRVALWRVLERLAGEQEISVLLTTHYMEEADRLARRVAILDRGRIVATGPPGELKSRVRGDHLAVTLSVSADMERAEVVLRELEETESLVREGATVHVRVADGTRALPQVVSALEGAGAEVAEIALSRPSLEDVYLAATGQSFERADDTERST